MRKHKISAMLFGTMLFCSICMSGCGEENTTSNQQESQSQKETDKLGSGNDLEESKSGFCNLNQFTAKTLDQQDFTKEDIASKDVTVLNFWSLLCGPCIQEMPEIAKFAKSLPENVQVLTVCLDGAEEIDYTRIYWKRLVLMGLHCFREMAILEKCAARCSIRLLLFFWTRVETWWERLL